MVGYPVGGSSKRGPTKGGLFDRGLGDRCCGQIVDTQAKLVLVRMKVPSLSIGLATALGDVDREWPGFMVQTRPCGLTDWCGIV
jgi:hypothetical protein